MSLSDSLPWAIAAGRNAGIANRNARAVDEWRKYAHKLEEQVEFYRAEAINGWAVSRAYRQVAKEKFGVDMKEEFKDELQERRRKESPNIAKLVDFEAPK